MKELPEILNAHKKSVLRYTRGQEDFITGVHFYLGYPYKKRCKNFWVKNKYVESHKWQLTYDEWIKIIDVYIKYLKLYLLSGMPYALGELADIHLLKYKPAEPTIDWAKTNARYGIPNNIAPAEKKKAYAKILNGKPIVYSRFTNSDLKGFKFMLKWKRKNLNVRWQTHWVMKMSEGFYTDTINYFKANRDKIDKLTTLY